MAWTRIAGSFAGLPLILAGPVLRQVTATSVTVWVALKSASTVTLTIFDRDIAGTKLAESPPRATTAIGTNLHIVAVTARIATPLVEGKIYFYDMRFAGDISKNSILAASTRPTRLEDETRLAYPPFKLPSFALPPADLNKLRLIQGSCRKPHGGAKDDPSHRESPDAMALLDQLIADSVDKPFDRPHQLFLTGDQIYADEVADVFLLMLTEAGDALMGWKEELPKAKDVNGVEAGPFQGAKLPATSRSHAILSIARFTTLDSRSHLMSLGEYLAMYLFVWSDELWFEPDPIATAADINAARGLNSMLPMDLGVLAEVDVQRKALIEFRGSLPKVRRALANVPSYMICDDHEVTDDWNMTRRFCETVYDSALGMRIIQNGLLAFAICQTWGNWPEQFWEGAKGAGTRLLKSIETMSKTEASGTRAYHNFDTEFRQRVGIHTAAALRARPIYGVFHDLDQITTVEGSRVSETSLLFHFTVEGPSHQAIVTDTRTWRSFPIQGMEMHGDLLDQPAVIRQFQTDAPKLGDRLLLVVTTTNIPPIPGIREAAFLGGAANYYVGTGTSPSLVKQVAKMWTRNFIYENDLLDSWEFPDAALDRLLVAVTDKFPNVGGVLTGQAVFLSGDVHFTFASRLAYWADQARLGDTGNGQKVKAVFGQFVASALKNEKGATRGLQKSGYGYTPKNWQQAISWPHAPRGYVGFNLPSAAPITKVGRIKPGLVTPGIDLKAHGKQPTLFEQIPPGGGDFELNRKPDYRYRLDYLGTALTGQTFDPQSSGGQIILNNLNGAAVSWANAGRRHRDLIHSGAARPQVVGYNSLSELSFVWQRADGSPASSPNDPQAINRRVRQTVRWEQRGGVHITPLFAIYDVSLNPDDAGFTRIFANKEP